MYINMKHRSPFSSTLDPRTTLISPTPLPQKPNDSESSPRETGHYTINNTGLVSK